MFRPVLILTVISFACVPIQAQGQPPSLGVFEQQSDVGVVQHPGSAEYDAAAKRYVVSGSGENMWAALDQFHYVWKQVSAADVTLTADLTILGTGGEGHRKGVLMIRQSLDTDSAYVDAARHGDGLTSLQYRDRSGLITREIESSVSGPLRLRLEKQGDLFYMWIGAENGPMQFSGGAARVKMQTPFYVGIGVCAHKKDAVEQVAFTNVTLETRAAHPKAAYSTVETVLLSGDARSGYVSTKPLAAASWSKDGHSLTFKAEGQTQEAPFTPLKTAAPVGPAVIPGDTVAAEYYASPQAGLQQIWKKTAEGAQPEQLTSDEFSNSSPRLSPDGKYLAFLSSAKTGNARAEMFLRVMSLVDSKIRTLAVFDGSPESLGPQPWSPDARRIVFVSYQNMD